MGDPNNLNDVPQQESEGAVQEKMMAGEPAPSRQNRVLTWTRKHLAVVIPVGAVIVLALVVFLSLKPIMLRAAPQMYLNSSFKNIGDINDKNVEDSPFGIFTILYQSLMKGSVKLSVGQLTSANDSILANLGIEAEMKSNLKENQMLLGATVKAGNTAIADGEIYLSPEQISLGSKIFLGGADHYGIMLSDIREKIKGSIFSPDSTSGYAMTESDVNEIVDSIEKMKMFFNTESLDWKEFQKELTPYVDEITSYVKPQVSTEKAKIDGKTVNATVMRYTYTEEDVRNVCAIFIEGLANSKTFKAGMNEQELNEFKNKLRLFQQDIKGESVGDIVVTYYINRKNQLMQISFEPGKNHALGLEDYSLVITYGAEPLKSGKMQMELQGPDVYVKLMSEKEKKDEQIINRITLAFDRSNAEQQFSIETKWNKQSGDLGITAQFGTEHAMLTGNLKYEGNDKFKLEITELEFMDAFSNESMPLKFSLTADATSEITQPAMKSVFDLKEEELNSLLDIVRDAADSLSSY